MTRNRLEEEGMFLPEEHRGELDLSSSTNRWAVLGLGVLGAVACTLMAAGGGGATTWSGAGLYAVFMVLFATLSNRAVERQNRRVEQLEGDRAEERRRERVEEERRS